MDKFFELIQAPLKEQHALEKIGGYFATVFIIYIFLLPVQIISAIPIIGWLIFCTVGLFLYAVLFVLQNSYFYEYAQAGLESRESRKVWDIPVMDNVKKAGKLFLVHIIYAIPLLVAWFPLMVLAAVAGDSTILLGLYITGICFLYLVTFLYAIYILIPASMQLIRNNTFNDAFKFNEIIANGIKNKAYNQLVIMQLVMALVILVVVVINVALTFIIIGICLWPFTIAALTYYSQIGLPYAIGSVYGKTS